MARGHPVGCAIIAHRCPNARVRNKCTPYKDLLTNFGNSEQMSNYLRPHRTGATVFFTVTLAQRGTDTLTRHIDTLRAAVHQTRSQRPFAINAWVVLPDHMHCIWTLPEGDSDFSTRMAAIKARFSRCLPEGHIRASHILRREKGIWQRRFWERHMRDDADLAAHTQYCWQNPVKHGLVNHAKDWPYSSYHRDNPPAYQTNRA